MSIVVAALLLPFVYYGASTVVKINENDIKQWLPKGFEEARKHTWFTKHFSVDEMIVASWEGCTADDPRLYKLSDELRNQKMSDGTPIYSRVISGADMESRILDTGCSAEEAAKRLKGVFQGPDGKQTCLLAFPAERWSQDRSTVVENFYKSANSTVGLTEAEIHLGGPTADGAAIDEESRKSLQQFIGVTVCTVFFLCWFRLKNFRLSLVVLGFSVYSALLALSILYWTGGKMNLTMIMLPTLLFILTVSACVHLTNYFHKAAQRGSIENAAIEALRGGGYPIALSSLTTAIGLASLAASQVVPIRLFGIYSATGLVASLPIVLIVLPATLHVFGAKFGIGKAEILSTPREKKAVSRRNALFVNWICRKHAWIVIPSVIGLIALACGAHRLKASVKILDRFSSRTKIIQDYQWLEDKLGPLVPMEVIVRFDDETNVKENEDGKTVSWDEWDRALLVRYIEDRLKEGESIGATTSACMFLPPFSNRKTAADVARKRASMQMWDQSLPQLIEGKLLANSDNEQLWRISVRMSALNDMDYGEFVEIVNNSIEVELEKLDYPGVSATLTGSIPMMYKAQHQVLTDLIQSFLMAFILISLVLIFVLRSVSAGLVAMVPNIFPPIMVFGAMGWMGFSIEIGSVMTASVALGIAVDDTIHFLTWYRRGTARGQSRFASIRNAFEHCSKAMIDTTLICGLGVACFMLSDFMPTVKFARLLLILLLVALIGDLLLLPAILAGSLGKLFRAKPNDKAKSDGDAKPDGNAETVGNSQENDHSTPVVPVPKTKRVTSGENFTKSH